MNAKLSKIYGRQAVYLIKLQWQLNVKGIKIVFKKPAMFTVQTAPGPQGDGSQGSGFSTHLWLWQTKPLWQSGSTTHSGLQPEMVSGLGMRPGWHLQMAFPVLVTEQSAP